MPEALSVARPLIEITGTPSTILLSILRLDKEGAVLSSETVIDIDPDFVSEAEVAVTSTR